MVHTARLSFLSPPAPQLPSFQTLLIQGDYPASSPIHLCLSHLSSNPRGSKSRPILITTNSKSKLTKSLVDLNDGWLATNAGRGMTADLLSRIQILCAQPRTSAIQKVAS
ncbi:hypothetical protein JB92DRAFT_2877704 [Gautieria morchelliformis]|nr:hypothetical protein JB92DRAFT_2877704 [Gautieria morchelliformis]